MFMCLTNIDMDYPLGAHNEDLRLYPSFDRATFTRCCTGVGEIPVRAKLWRVHGCQSSQEEDMMAVVFTREVALSLA